MVVGVAGTNPAGGLDVCPLHVVLSCVGRGLCDALIPRPKDLYHVSKTRETLNKERRPWLDPGWSAIWGGGYSINKSDR